MNRHDVPSCDTLSSRRIRTERRRSVRKVRKLVPTEAELARAENRAYQSAAQLLECIASLNTKSTGKPNANRPNEKRRPSL